MLSLKNIVKDYPTGDTTVRALDGVSIDFRENEFVSILGPSGCGKTTLLNIIGGLDQYTEGDLIINGISTKQYNDKDWDTYRNHSIGFVFQSYNLIPHQTVLSNVELALTLSGVSKKERRRRAIEALETVGLSDQIHKKPNQMSGGQMQRVAIARALVNDPDILLADEPTGALDTQTSVQIMEILHKIAEKKLIIMVTHNPDLAHEYSSRIIQVVDGRVVNDSAPYEAPAVEPVAITKKKAKRTKQVEGSVVKGKRSMSFFTALSLSLNNLMTKKGRTFMTAFAGSIGIIGIALILSVSSGVNAYINSVQRETLAGYPLELHAESMDLSAMITSLMEAKDDESTKHGLDRIYESIVLGQMVNALGSTEATTNDLKSFKAHLEASDEFDDYLSAIQYSYNFNWSVFVREGNAINGNAGPVVKSDITAWMSGMSGAAGSSSSAMGGMGMMSSGMTVWKEMLAPLDREGSEILVNDLLNEQYEFVDEGSRWPTAANEVVLVVDKNNEISDLSLFALGLRTEKEMNDGMMAAMNGQTVDLSTRKSWSFEEIRQMEFRLLLATECYEKQADGSYLDLSKTAENREKLYTNSDIGFTLKVVGIVRPREGVSSTSMTAGSIGYTYLLAEEALDRTLGSELLNAQKANPDRDMISGLLFQTDKVTTEQRKTAVDRYLASLATEKERKDFLLKVFSPLIPQEQIDAEYTKLAALPDDQLRILVENALAEAGEDLSLTVDQVVMNAILKDYFLKEMARAMANEAVYGEMTAAEMQAMLTDGYYMTLYEEDVIPKDFSESNYLKNLTLLGDVQEDSPATIYLYSSTFENKDKIGELIEKYNDSVEDEKKIDYTDYVKLLMSSITTVLNAITYVLIAFVAISLIVSSIMIGIITYISVLERTKEIGILRAVGASKRDVGRVFNAETLIIGFTSGVIGIVVTLLLNLLINVILFKLTGIPNLKAALPPLGGVILVAISMGLTFIAGLFPSGFAAKKNPVEALRTE